MCLQRELIHSLCHSFFAQISDAGICSWEVSFFILIFILEFFCLLCKHVRIGKAKIIIAFPSDSSTLIFKWIHYRKSLHYRKSHSKENRTFDFVLFQGTNRKLCICFSQSSGIFCHFYNHYSLPFFFKAISCLVLNSWYSEIVIGSFTSYLDQLDVSSCIWKFMHTFFFLSVYITMC